MRFRSFYLAAATLLLGALVLPQSAHASYLLANIGNTKVDGSGTVTHNGNGTAVDNANGYTIYGSTNGAGSYVGDTTNACSTTDSCYNYTTYTTSSSSDRTLSFGWSYSTSDDGSWYDPAGYVIDGVYTQLTPDNYPYTLSDGTVIYSGIVTLNLLAGQTYGFYVYSYDSMCGGAQIAISYVPLPAALPLFASALLGVGAVARRKRSA